MFVPIALQSSIQISHTTHRLEKYHILDFSIFCTPFPFSIYFNKNKGTIKNHMGQYGTIHTGPYKIIQDHTGPYKTIRDHIGPNETKQDHIGT